jgi:hypothetical protein
MNSKYYISPAELKDLLAFLERHHIGSGVQEFKQAEEGLILHWPRIEGRDPIQLVFGDGNEHNAGLMYDYMTRYLFKDEQTGAVNEGAAAMVLRACLSAPRA